LCMWDLVFGVSEVWGGVVSGDGYDGFTLTLYL